jgi:invasion protein IalB
MRKGLASRLAASVIALAPLATTGHAQTTKSETRFDDWVVACDDSSGTKRCSLSQTFTKSGTGEVVLAWILAKDTDGKLKAVVYTPTQVLLAPGLVVNEIGLDAITAPYRYCAPQACVAEFPFDENWLAAFRKNDEYSVTFLPVSQKPATVKGSLKGFSAAYDFFLKQ